ncbi:histone-lysine N-methyltransferase, H3 lysine-79 specific [Polytolypa hystricis UAMH7299]|uniref:Histone-lysine N-methyltransferase, H3 lysine-79 specific n=1 Tax=Polytolypa hystricis (strain UAMH7299) TaxID=1447883 RepID=A0A2B7YEE7_POLH7|nr:histone-lysine N-methyltransferase, H3 lysine-79 specific [Polytolypa hystricis UAMH7299]
MGFFDHLQKKGSVTIQPQRTQIRKVESKPAAKPPARVPSVSSTKNTNSNINGVADSQSRVRPVKRSRESSRTLPASRDQTPSRSSTPLSRRSKSVVRKRPSPIQRLSSSDDDSDSDASLSAHKRVKASVSAEPDLERRIRSSEAFSEDGETEFAMVHAVDITLGSKHEEFKSVFVEETEKPATIGIRYPGAPQPEQYQIVAPRDKNEFRPLDDIAQVMDIVSQNYIPESERHIFDDERDGLKRRYKLAVAHASLSELQKTVADYNKTLDRLRGDGQIAKHLDSMHALSLPLVERILTQIYSRTVSPRVDSLKQYENGTDNVYGELLPRFISDIFKQTRLKSGQVFVDLGSGVGNVVLQAALEIGCESWGCEMMQNACDLAELQQKEFTSRCRLWGIAAGEVHLIKGDFLKDENIPKILSRADVVLINNQAFTPQLNNELINHFLDMKEGCQIVSLKSFVPAGHKIQSRNLNSPVNLLSVKRRNYWSGSVSWTDVGGTYFIATKDSSRLKAFSEGLLKE